MERPSIDQTGAETEALGSAGVIHRPAAEAMSHTAMRRPVAVPTATASAPPSDRRSQPCPVNVTRRVGSPVLPFGPNGTATSVADGPPSFVENIRVGPVGRQPFASGRKTCESSVIGVGVGGRVEVARAVAAAVGVAVGAALELAADGVLVGATAAGAEHPAIVSANSAATTKRMPSG